MELYLEVMGVVVILGIEEVSGFCSLAKSIEEREWCKYIIQLSVHNGRLKLCTKPPWRAPRTLVSTSTFGKVVIEETRTRRGQDDQDSAAQRWRSGHPTSKQLRSVEVLVERKRNLGCLAEGRDGGYRYGLGPATAGKNTASLTLLFSVFGGLQDQPLTNKVWESEDNCSNLPTLWWISSGICSTQFLRAPPVELNPSYPKG